MSKETSVELARIVGKVEAGKKLTAVEVLMLLPYYYLHQAEKRIEEARKNVRHV